MKIVKNTDQTANPSKTISGKNQLIHILPPQQVGGIGLSIVRFEGGALTHWHTHPGEQVLYILEGRGLVGNETEAWEVEPGDVVYTGPGERHWHGALPGETMTHISITNIGAPNWFEEVHI